MTTELHQDELVNTASAQGAIALPSAGTENLPILLPASKPETQWQQWSRKVTHFLDQLPSYIESFFQQYLPAVITVILILSAIVTVKVVLAVLGAINEIPLLSPIFELIGIGYATWFTSRYLIKAVTRQELAARFQVLKQQILGDEISELSN